MNFEWFIGHCVGHSSKGGYIHLQLEFIFNGTAWYRMEEESVIVCAKPKDLAPNEDIYDTTWWGQFASFRKLCVDGYENEGNIISLISRYPKSHYKKEEIEKIKKVVRTAYKLYYDKLL